MSDFNFVPPGATPPKVDPADLPGWLLAEDDDYLVFDKPGWLVCHPSKDGPWSSLVGAVKAWRGMEVLHLVSRLDRETSGLILIAKHFEAASAAQTAMERRWVTKTYYALLKGTMPEPVMVDQPLGPDETPYRLVTTEGGQPFVTLNGRPFTLEGDEWVEGARTTASAGSPPRTVCKTRWRGTPRPRPIF